MGRRCVFSTHEGRADAAVEHQSSTCMRGRLRVSIVFLLAMAAWFVPGLIVQPGCNATDSCMRLLDQGAPLS